MISVHKLGVSAHPSSFGKGFYTQTPTIGDFFNLITSHVWSPCIWDEGVRKKSKFIKALYLVLDFDDGRWTIKDAVNWCRKFGLWYMIGTTKSHQKEKKTPTGKIIKGCDRFRLIIKMKDYCEDIEDYEYTMMSVMRKVPCDKAAKDAGRFFYPCQEIVSYEQGLTIDWKKKPDEDKVALKRMRKIAKFKAEKGIFPHWIRYHLLHGLPKNKRNTLCFALAVNLKKYGFTEEDIVQKVLHSPTDFNGFSEREVRAAVRSGYHGNY